MLYLLCITAGILIGGVTMFWIIVMLQGQSHRSRKRKSPRVELAKNKHKIEFSKFILMLILFTYFIGVAVGIKVVFIDISQLGILLAFIGTPTAAAIGFYCWKAKAENLIKIKKDNPEETAGMPVDLNSINP